MYATDTTVPHKPRKQLTEIREKGWKKYDPPKYNGRNGKLITLSLILPFWSTNFEKEVKFWDNGKTQF